VQSRGYIIEGAFPKSLRDWGKSGRP